jgi:hypothetical protein
MAFHSANGTHAGLSATKQSNYQRADLDQKDDKEIRRAAISTAGFNKECLGVTNHKPTRQLQLTQSVAFLFAI